MSIRFIKWRCATLQIEKKPCTANLVNVRLLFSGLTYRDGGAINIAVGVVGFCACLLLLVGAAWWYHKRKKRIAESRLMRKQPTSRALSNGGPLPKEKTEKVSIV